MGLPRPFVLHALPTSRDCSRRLGSCQGNQPSPSLLVRTLAALPPPFAAANKHFPNRKELRRCLDRHATLSGRTTSLVPCTRAEKIPSRKTDSFERIPKLW